MTDNNHPITPPPELVQQWECEYHHMTYGPDLSIFISEKAARWGADQELEACCEVLARELICDGKHVATDLRAARRPKPPSLKEEALALLQVVEISDDSAASWDFSVIRRALESLPD